MIVIEDRLSDSPYVERVWRSYSQRSGLFTSIAVTQFDLVIEKLEGKYRIFLHGPETKATQAYCPPEGEWLGILFKFGTFLPKFPPSRLMDAAISIPGASSRSFWLNSAAWEIPTFENADTFVERLATEGIVRREPLVENILYGQPNALSLRSAQRHFLRATGMNLTASRQIERARYATTLLRQGQPILDTVFEAGYFDQPHLTRSLKRFIGQTPAQIIEQNPQLSLLYDTTPLGFDTIELFNPFDTTQGVRNGQSREDYAQRYVR